MHRALELAKLGGPSVAPNPMVGCVIVKDNKIISEGYHEKFGGAHAEVNAIKNIPPGILPAECTLYVTLEPCNHFGKTPPCTDLILEKGFRQVVIAGKDPNPLVSGKGIQRLRDGDVTVIEGVLEKEQRSLNKHFVTYHEKKRPYYLLKWAMTGDGFISKYPVPEKREDNIITGIESQTCVHKMRSEVMAIMVGKNTVLADNPSLTVRLTKGKNPLRIFFDRKLEVPLNYSIYNTESKTIVFNDSRSEVRDHINYIKLDFEDSVFDQVNAVLYGQNIQSVLVEGGTILINDLLKNKLWDEIAVFQNPGLFFREGVKAPDFLVKDHYESLGKDRLFRFFKEQISDNTLKF